MCGRYTLYSPAGDIRTLLGAPLSDHELSVYRESRGYNVAPSQTAPICILHEERRAIVPAHWGFRPHWARDNAPTPINAKAETVLQKPYYRDAIRRGRCLVPCSGWYEWQFVSAQQKQPFYSRPIPKSSPSPASTTAGRTNPAAASPSWSAMRPRDYGRSIVVRPEDYDTWLSPTASPKELERILNYRHHNIERVPVNKRVGNPRNDDRDLIDPIK